MFIQGNKISIRAIEPADVHLLYGWENDLEIWKISYTQVPFSKFILEEFVNSIQDIYTIKQLRLMINNTENGETVGCIDLFDFEPQHNRCGIGVFINKNYRNNGFAAEAISLIKEYCFKILYLHQVYVHVDVSNAASLSLFEKAGFEKSGIKKQWHKTGKSTFEDVYFLQCIFTE